MEKEQILIIKHGALGDIVLASGPMQAIRAHHPEAHIVLLTTPAFKPFMESAPFIDEIWTDSRPKIWTFWKWGRLKKKFNSRSFSWVYDLQTSERSGHYFKLFNQPKPNWSGIAKKASHRHDTPHRTQLHTIDRQKEQLAIAGIKYVPEPSLKWLEADVTKLKPDGSYILIVPGGSSHRPQKRWPVTHYIQLCEWLIRNEVTPVLIGAGAERDILQRIEEAVPNAINLCKRTDFAQLAVLARNAAYAVGNDTGPMHIIAASGCNCTVLFSADSDPDLCSPAGSLVKVLQRDDLDSLSSDIVELSVRLPKSY